MILGTSKDYSFLLFSIYYFLLENISSTISSEDLGFYFLGFYKGIGGKSFYKGIGGKSYYKGGGGKSYYKGIGGKSYYKGG